MADENGGWPSGLKVTQDATSITVTDPFGNQLKLSAAGIELSSVGDVKIQGFNVSIDAESMADIRGGMSASVQGGTELTLKGAMVMIN